MSFRLGTLAGRAVLVHDGGVHDLETHAPGLGSDPMEAIARHRELHAVAASLAGTEPDYALDIAQLGPPVPAPQQVFAIGLNYSDHASESGLTPPPRPLVFTKFRNAIAAPHGRVEIRGQRVDFEVELVVVIGTGGRDIAAANAWDHIAGFTIGQDISDRDVQFDSTPPHFDLGKSFDGYGPIGPLVVSLDLLEDPTDLAITCDVNGERRQDSRTSQLIFGIPDIIEYVSAITSLEPGDLFFTGTPAGVGLADGRFLRSGDVVTSGIDGLGEFTIEVVGRETHGLLPSRSNTVV